MRLQRSPTAHMSGRARSPMSMDSSPDSTQSNGTTATSYGQQGRQAFSPTEKEHATRSTLVGHYAHHARQPSSLSSVDLHGTTGEFAQSTTKDHKHAGSIDSVVSTGSMNQHLASAASRQPGSYATQAYREFLASATASAVTSAASSVAQSRQSSRSNSGYSSQAISGQSSRTASPMSKREEREDGQIYEFGSQGRMHASAGGAQAPYLETQFQNGHVLNHATTTNVTQQVSTLSFSNMVLSKSESQESLEEGGVTHERPQPRLRPNHFTFCEQDIMKSFLRAAERDRARADREERAREAQQRVEMEQEYERRKQQAKEQAAREMAFQAHTARYETVGETLSADSSPEPAAAVATRRRRRFPPVPAHFKFTSHDVNKSAAKPSQRQNIGHWTTFPRSSTIMLAAAELKKSIREIIAEQFEAQKQLQLQLQLQQQQHQVRKQSSAPNSPVSSSPVRQLVAQAPLGSSTSRLPSGGRGASVSRRASMPSVYDAPVKTTGNGSTTIPIRAGHSRSTSYSHGVLPPAKILPMDRSNGMEKSSNGTASSIRRASLDSLTRAHNAAAGGFERSTSLPQAHKPVKGLPLNNQSSVNSQQSVAQMTAAAIDAAARRAQMLQARHGQSQTMRPVHSTDSLGLHGSSTSLPGSTGSSPNRTVNGRAVKSAHVSPTRPDQRRMASTPQRSQANGISAQTYTPQPPLAGRKASIGGGAGESKIASAANSPNLPGRSVDQTWYEKSINDGYATNTNGYVSNGQQQGGFQKAALNTLYRDVPSSGYGQRVR